MTREERAEQRDAIRQRLAGIRDTRRELYRIKGEVDRRLAALANEQIRLGAELEDLAAA